jgi:hypothetical protein
MTGSGKTGLCIDLLEEVLLGGTPLFLLDPKGDVTNLLLTFPQLRGEDFAAWVDPDAARRAGRSLAEEGAAQAKLWREGLAKWDVPLDSVGKLREGAAYRVFTPGSRTGRPVDVLGSLSLPPGLSFERDEEAVRDEVRGLVSGLLSLSGIEADPVSDPRHIVLARVLETLWRDGKSADLAGLIALTENPPFRRVGALDLDAVLPAREEAGPRARAEQSPLLARLRRLALGGAPRLRAFPDRLLGTAGMQPLLPGASRRPGAPLLRDPVPRALLGVDPGAVGVDGAAGSPLLRRDLRFPAAGFRAVLETPAPVAVEAGARLRRRCPRGDAESGGPRLQGPDERRDVARRAAPGGARQGASARRPRGSRARDVARRDGQDALGPREAAVPPPRRAPLGRTRRLRVALGAGVPARSTHAAADPGSRAPIRRAGSGRERIRCGRVG